MDPATADFTDELGEIFAADGHPPIAGRVLALLMLSPIPLSLDDLADQLAVCKASVSTNARHLAGLGLARLSHGTTDRRDYYEVADRLFLNSMRQRLARWQRFGNAVAAVRQAPDSQDPRVRQRLEGFERGFRLTATAIRQALGRWESEAGEPVERSA